jgi:hypothetical protein
VNELIADGRIEKAGVMCCAVTGKNVEALRLAPAQMEIAA